MSYSFHFEIPKEMIYFHSGFKSFDEAKSKLEEISSAHCKEENSAIGRVYEKNEIEITTLSEYEISRKRGKIILKTKN